MHTVKPAILKPGVRLQDIAAPGGGVSQTWTPLEGEYALAWAANIWADSLA